MNLHSALSFCLSMIFFGKPVPTFPDHALEIAGLQPERSLGAIFGAPGGAGATHVVQFRPIGIECLGDELAPEGPEAGEGAGKGAGKGAGRSGVADGRDGEGGRRDGCHDAGSLFSLAAFAAWGAFSASNTSLGLIY